MHHLLPYYSLAARLEHNFFREISCIDNVVFTAVSPSVAEEVHKNGLSLLPFVIPNGLELNCPELYNKYHARALLQEKYSLQLAENDRILLYIGRITEVKQPLLLLNLFKAIQAFYPNIHLIIAGKGNLYRKLRKRADHQHNIHILGYVSDHEIFLLYRAADVFISLSCYEGLPLTVLEAASFHLPLILSDIPAHRWIINSRTGYGELVNSRNPNPLKILKFIDSLNNVEKPFTELSTKYYTWGNIISQYLKLLCK
jgi:glycosyltransferase involved in cell wall biosynthesis